MSKKRFNIAFGHIMNALSRDEGHKTGNLKFYQWLPQFVRVTVKLSDGGYLDISPAMDVSETELWAEGLNDEKNGRYQSRYHNSFYYNNGVSFMNNYLSNDPHNPLNKHKEQD